MLPKQKLEGFFSLVFEALQDKVMLLLICAAIVSIVLGALPWTSEDPVCISFCIRVLFTCASCDAYSCVCVNKVGESKGGRELNEGGSKRTGV